MIMNHKGEKSEERRVQSFILNTFMRLKMFIFYDILSKKQI